MNDSLSEFYYQLTVKADIFSSSYYQRHLEQMAEQHGAGT
jgi:hypothetical protein